MHLTDPPKSPVLAGKPIDAASGGVRNPLEWGIMLYETLHKRCTGEDVRKDAETGYDLPRTVEQSGVRTALLSGRNPALGSAVLVPLSVPLSKPCLVHAEPAKTVPPPVPRPGERRPAAPRHEEPGR